MITQLELDEAKTIAEAATPGPWAYGYWSGICYEDHAHGRDHCNYKYELIEAGTSIVLKNEPVTLCTSTDEYYALSKYNAEHIAHFNPEFCLRLIEELEESIKKQTCCGCCKTAQGVGLK